MPKSGYTSTLIPSEIPRNRIRRYIALGFLEIRRRFTFSATTGFCCSATYILLCCASSDKEELFVPHDLRCSRFFLSLSIEFNLLYTYICVYFRLFLSFYHHRENNVDRSLRGERIQEETRRVHLKELSVPTRARRKLEWVNTRQQH